MRILQKIFKNYLFWEIAGKLQRNFEEILKILWKYFIGPFSDLLSKTILKNLLNYLGEIWMDKICWSFEEISGKYVEQFSRACEEI